MWSAKHWRQGIRKSLWVSEYLQHFCDTSLPEKFSAHKTELTSQIESNKRSFKSLKAANPRKWKRSDTKPLQHLCDTSFPENYRAHKNWIEGSHYCQEKNTCLKKNRINQKIFQILEDCDSEKMEAVGQQTSATDTSLPEKTSQHIELNQTSHNVKNIQNFEKIESDRRRRTLKALKTANRRKWKRNCSCRNRDFRSSSARLHVNSSLVFQTQRADRTTGERASERARERRTKKPTQYYLVSHVLGRRPYFIPNKYSRVWKADTNIQQSRSRGARC
jgi:hypothetical protein